MVLKIMWSLPNGTKIQYGSRNFCEKLDCFLYVNYDWSPELDSSCIEISYLLEGTTISKGPHYKQTSLLCLKWTIMKQETMNSESECDHLEPLLFLADYPVNSHCFDSV